MFIKRLCTGVVVGVSLALLTAPQLAQGEEKVLRAVCAFPKTNPLCKSFMRFIDKANDAGKGLFRINYIGGPEITKPREQPNAMRNGLFEMMYGPGPYYAGLFPETDFIHFTNPMQVRSSGAFEMLREVMKEKMSARFMGWFDSGLGLFLYTIKEPKRTATGGVDLTGMKLRTSPSYRDFVKDLGGTAVVMRGGEVYTALERGTINGMGIGLTEILDFKLDRFVRYRIEPPMTHTGLFMIMNQKVYDGLPKGTQDLLDKLSLEWEAESRAYWKVQQDKTKTQLEAAGIKTVTLPPPAAAEFVRTFRKGAWARMERNKKMKIDLVKLRKLLDF